MNNPNTFELFAAFDQIIEGAWRNSSSVQAGAHAEQNHVARFIHGVPVGMAAAIKSIPDVKCVEVQGTFCHASPYAFWLSGTEYVKKEMGDLLVAVELTSFGFPKASRALIIQTKMGSRKARTWCPPIILTVDALQRELYAELRPFCLELPGRPTRDNVSASTQNLADFMANGGATPFPAPYDLTSFAPNVPVGMVYAAIDKARARVGHPDGPWLAESGRPANTGTSVTFDFPFALALAMMVAEKESPYGVRSDFRNPRFPDWYRLIADLRDWADARALDMADGTHGVQLAHGASRDGVFHNVQRMLSVNQVFEEQGCLKGVLSWAGCTSSAADAMRLERQKLEHMYFVRRSFKESEPPGAWPSSVEIEEPGGFGVLSIKIELDPKSKTWLHPGDRHY